MIRYRVVLGVANTTVRERLLREDNLDQEKAVRTCQAVEATERQIKSLSTEKGVSNSDMNYCKNTGRRQQEKITEKNAAKCKWCDTMHSQQACPAFGKACNKYKNNVAISQLFVERNPDDGKCNMLTRMIKQRHFQRTKCLWEWSTKQTLALISSGFRQFESKIALFHS